MESGYYCLKTRKMLNFHQDSNKGKTMVHPVLKRMCMHVKWSIELCTLLGTSAHLHKHVHVCWTLAPWGLFKAIQD